jgi:hypothetical protein
MDFFIPLSKVDEEKRLVIGIAAQETPDKSGEILDYESGKPAFQKWSDECFKASNGLSKGNLRVMHGKQVAGKIVDINFDDETKAIHVMAKVNDDGVWKQCLSGDFLGFSVGGGYAKRWSDNGLTRYTPEVRELSLVDCPCIPTARFVELVKADGLVEQLPLRGRPPATFGELLKRATPPATFADLLKAAQEPLGKGFQSSKHPREHDGKFASKTGEKVGRGVLGYAGIGAGAVAGLRYAPQIADLHEQAARSGYRAYARAQNLFKPAKTWAAATARTAEHRSGEAAAANFARLVARRTTPANTMALLGGVGSFAGAALGAQYDRWRRRRRAAKANKLDQYRRLNADVSVLPTSKDLQDGARKALRHTGKTGVSMLFNKMADGELAKGSTAEALGEGAAHYALRFGNAAAHGLSAAYHAVHGVSAGAAGAFGHSIGAAADSQFSAKAANPERFATMGRKIGRGAALPLVGATAGGLFALHRRHQAQMRSYGNMLAANTIEAN